MSDSPLFDHVAAKPARRAKSATPLLPVPAKPQPQIWVIQFSAAPGHTAPPVCRIRMLLKTAWRQHRLRAKILAGPPPIAAPCEPTHDMLPEVPAGPQIAFNEAE